MFQPVGGMGRIGEAFARQIPNRIRYGAKVVSIQQNETGVTRRVRGPRSRRGGSGGQSRLVRVRAAAHHSEPAPDRCVRADEGRDRRRSVRFRGQVRIAVLAPVLGGGRAHIRRDQPIPICRSDRFPTRARISTPAARACCSAATRSTDPTLTSSRRCRRPRESGARSSSAPRSIRNTWAEFENGVSVAWHRVPFTLGCAGDWSDEARSAHYNDLCQIDGRIVLAGEHASYIPAWQEGAILSALDAIQRLHKRVVAS